MKKHIITSIIVASTVLCAFSFTGCENSSKEKQIIREKENSSEKETESEVPKGKETDIHKTQTTENNKPEIASGLTDVQWNSVSMLNYLTVLSQEINSSKNSRLFLEEAYSSLLNNTYPNAVDSRTQIELEDLLDILEKYRMLSVKRDRLQYIYEQNCAQALKAAIPNPLGLLSAVKSGNLLSAATSVIYMAVDSYSSYTKYTSDTDLQYLQDGWALDDEEASTLHESRSATFSYMIDMVREHNIPGYLTLYEKAVEDFAEWNNKPNIAQRIQFLETNENTYQAFGEYWLVLAKSYFENGQYNDCLSAIAKYESIQAKIFRKDYEYANTMPYAIAAASETLSGDDYIRTVEHFIDVIVNNSDQDEWKLRYLAAQVNIDLFKKTDDKRYLQAAYDIVLNNVNRLVDTQIEQNKIYLADVVEEPYPDGATKEKKAEIDNYNKQIENARETELAPISEPLLLNCQTLFALAQELNISDNEKMKINRILHYDGNRLFLVPAIDDLFWFEVDGNIIYKELGEELKIRLGEDTIRIKAKYVTPDTKITATVKRASGDDVVFEDWVVSDVDRKKDDFDSFIVTYYSESADDFSYEDGDMLYLTINPKDGYVSDIYEFKYSVSVSTGIPDFWNTYVKFKMKKTVS